MKFFISLIALIGIVASGFWLYKLIGQQIAFKKELADVGRQVTPLTKENSRLLAEIDYFQEPANLEKELRARSHYTGPGEGLIIIIPPQVSE